MAASQIRNHWLQLRGSGASEPSDNVIEDLAAEYNGDRIGRFTVIDASSESPQGPVDRESKHFEITEISRFREPLEALGLFRL